MKAIELHYNKEIVGGKAVKIYKKELERRKENKTDIIDFLSNHGCPQNTPYKYKGCECRCYKNGCIKCWEQEVEV